MADAIVISQEAKQEFWQSGAIRIQSVLDETWLRLLRDTVDEEIRNAGPGGHFADPGRATFFASIRPWRWRDVFRRFVFESPAASIASQLLGSPSVQLFSDQLFVKEPGAVERTPWHQDLPFWPLRGTKVLSVWVALDHVDLASGGLEYVRGSHRSGAWYRPQRFTRPAPIGDDGERYDTSPDFDSRPPGVDFLSWTLEPGDCVVHHARTVHGGGGNQSSDRRRRGYSSRWFGDDVVYEASPGRVQLEECQGLADGDALPSGSFPLVSPKELCRS